MSVKNLRIVGAWFGLVTAVACGPEPTATESTWMLGVWSGAQPGGMIKSCGVPRLEIREDGVLIEGSGAEGTCVSYPEPGGSYEYTWERRGDDEIDAPSVTYPDSGFRIERGEDCNQIVVRRFQNDVEYAMMPYYRGKVCAGLICPPDVGNCVDFETSWCEGEEAPPACEDAEMP